MRIGKSKSMPGIIITTVNKASSVSNYNVINHRILHIPEFEQGGFNKENMASTTCYQGLIKKKRLLTK